MAHALEHGGSLVLVGGEAGMGKTACLNSCCVAEAVALQRLELIRRRRHMRSSPLIPTLPSEHFKAAHRASRQSRRWRRYAGENRSPALSHSVAIRRTLQSVIHFGERCGNGILSIPNLATHRIESRLQSLL
jgi:hypothetical protein